MVTSTMVTSADSRPDMHSYSFVLSGMGWPIPFESFSFPTYLKHKLLIKLQPPPCSPFLNPGGWGVHMLGVQGCAARHGVLFEGMCSLRVYLFANFSCLCSLRYAFQPDSKLCVPWGFYNLKVFWSYFMFSQCQGQVVKMWCFRLEHKYPF